MDYRQFIEQVSKSPIPKEMAFPELEYRGRGEKVGAIMDEMGLDALLVTFLPNVCYLSGYQAFAADLHACMVLPREGEPTLQVSELEIPGALLNSWVKDVRGVKWIDLDAISVELARLLRERGLDGKRIGVEMKRPGLTIDAFENLKRLVPSAQFVDASDMVSQVRRLKSPAELDHMRRAASVTIKGMEAALAAVKPGATDNDVAAAGYQALISGGSEYFSSQPSVSSGQRTGWSHTSFKRVPIQTGDTVIVELGAAYQRYTSALMHTAVLGQPSDTVRRLAEASSGTIDLLLQNARPGRTAHDVAQDVRKGLKELEGDVYRTGHFGYSIGLSLPPAWREMITFIAEGIDETLLPGMTFHSPITLRIPGVVGAAFSDTWAVTETGCEVLTPHDRGLYVVPA